MNRSRMVIVPAWCAVVLGTGFLAGCQGSPYEVLIAKPEVGYIEDVPVPMDFDLNEDESLSRNYPDKNAREIDFVFEGNAHKLAAKRFYEKKMPLYRWSMTSSQLSQGRINMHFVKGGEECRIDLDKKEFWGGTRISISVHKKTRAR